MRCLVMLMFVACLGSVVAQPWPDKTTATPNLVQTGFGPNGSSLPFDGGEYCGPTSAGMALGYLNAAGFTQLLGSSPAEPDYLNLVRVLSGLFEASDSGGTLSLDGVSTYFSAKGISPANTAITSDNDGYHRNISEIQSENVDQNILIGLLGWYSEDGGYYTRNGGHFFVITDQSPGTLKIHNPFPYALLNVPNTAPNVPQILPMANFSVTSNNTSSQLPVGTYLQFAADQQGVGPTLGTQAVVEQVFRFRIDASQLPANGFTPQDWEIAGTKKLNTGGGNLRVTTKVTGTGGIEKSDAGEVVFERDVSLTGNHAVSGGALVTTVKSGSAFGTGSISLSGTGGLQFRPDDAIPANVNLAVASRADSPSADGAQVTFSAANQISLARGNNTSLTLTLGGNDGNGVSNLVGSGSAPTLVIAAGDLGSTEKLLVKGSGANLPLVTNGTVGGNIVGASGPSGDGRFLTYDVTEGFRSAVTFSGNISDSTSATIYRATSAQTLSANASAYTIEVNATTINGSFALSVGSNSMGTPAGLILNGGTVATATIDFGASQAAIYTSQSGGTINAALVGSGGLVKFGAGTLELNASSPALTGSASIHSGTVAVNAASALGTSNPVSVLAGATLAVNGPGAVGGTIVAQALSTVTLNGGTIGNINIQSATNNSGPIQGATLQGAGTITGNVTLDGYIAADPSSGAGSFTIDGLVTPDDGAAWIWSLDTLVDNTGGNSGVDWNSINLTNPEATFGIYASGLAVSLLFDFGDGLDPNSGNAFWNTDHEWTVLTFSGRVSAFERALFSFPTSAFPVGYFSFGHVENETLLYFTAIPEPGTFGLICLALSAFWAFRRKRATAP